MPRRPSADLIAEDERRQLRRQQDFRVAADAVAKALAKFEEVERVALFGSCARPLVREVPRFQPYRSLRIEIWHECKDVDLAVWLSRTDRLRELSRARNQAVSRLFAATQIGVANHQVDVFLLSAEDGRYLGRLCLYSSCPKGKLECLVPGCGATAFLRQHEDFVFAADALIPGKALTLFDRRVGAVAKAADLPSSDL